MIVACAMIAAPLLVVAAPAAAEEAGRTIVSLTFDDGNANQTIAVDLMDAHGLDGTFYVPSGFIGEQGYLSLGDLEDMAAAGHEIGGHSVTHPDMTGISAAEAKREACLGRAALTGWGFDVTSFAYPFALVNDAAKDAVRACGFNSARGLGEIETRFGCEGCGFAESFVAADPFAIRAPALVDATWTLAALQSTVTNAENSGGGWVPLTFHHLCDGCDPAGYSVLPSVFSAFVDWLAARAATQGTEVSTVHEVVGGAVAPLVDTAFPPAVEPGVNGIVNPSLEDPPGEDGPPRCWTGVGFGSSRWTYDIASPGHTGLVAARIAVSDYADGDAKAVVDMDLGDCAPTVVPGRRYALRAWYTSDVLTQFSVFLRDPAGGWSYWTSSPNFAAAATFTEAAWDTEPIPRNATGISFGLSMPDDGVLVTDDYSLLEIEGPPPDISPALPSVVGWPAVGSRLTAVPGAWSPETSALSFQWLRNGRPIECARQPTYRPGTSDIGAVLSVRVRGAAFGYTGASAHSAAATPVQPATGGTPTLSSAFSQLSSTSPSPTVCR